MGTIGLAPGHALLATITAREQALLDRGGFVLPPSAASAVPSDPNIAPVGLRTIPPGETAGNVDIKQLSKGAHLLIPVDTPGGLFSAGDAHYAQGDCETCGTAIEMNSTLHVRFAVRKGEAAHKGIHHPRFYRQDYYLPPEFAAPRRFYATTGISVTRDGVDHSEDVSLAAARIRLTVRRLSSNNCAKAASTQRSSHPRTLLRSSRKEISMPGSIFLVEVPATRTPHSTFCTVATRCPRVSRQCEPTAGKNAEFDKLLEAMAVTAPTDPKFMSLYHQAMEIWFPNLPTIPLINRYIFITPNTTYWMNWPNANNPYTLPSSWHRTSGLFINTLQPATG